MVEGCFPVNESGVAVALRAFVDASGQGDVFSVAGIAFGCDRAKKAEKRWSERFGSREIHMTDLHSRNGAFRDISPDEGGDILKDAVSIINRHMQFFAVASCRVSEMPETLQLPATGDPVVDTLSKGIGSPYAWCVHTVMHQLGALSRLHSPQRSEINYVIETGDTGQGKVKEYIRFVEDHPVPALRMLYDFRGAVFSEKIGQYVLLQTSDILCWEWAKHIRRKDEGKPIRPSIDALFGGCTEIPHKYGFTGVSGEKGRGIASHYEGDGWQGGLLDLFAEMSALDANYLTTLYGNNPQ